MYGLLENIKQAFDAIRMNMLRAVLTVFIIAFGIMSLISMLTAVDGMKNALYSSFASIGSNTFTVSYEDAFSGMQRGGRRMRDPVPISYQQASGFQQRFTFPAQVSLSFEASDGAVIQYLSTKTPPKINVIGADQYHVPSSGLQLAEGRNFTGQEVQNGRKVAIIGSSLHEDLFGTQEAVGKTIS
ncbi:MAG: ABC transporter permease, partial [Bacteroidia bacterium]